ncbi:glycosyltransferase family 1 protein [Shimia sp. R9_3]|uniref:glycosyltransferase family 4 protein n=1 Tax=Shimia sp. R9_3 TaxID=2821113 RepID=UPI001ADAC676|nr:glycosyltransferase family 4 protein [Shimia sp. R9_3]
MTTRLPVFVNGRFLTADTTAVNTVARELTLALARLQATDADVAARYDLKVVVPPAAKKAAQALGIPFQVFGRLGGIFWEQLELPRLSRRGRIAGFFNTAPLLGKNHVTMLHDAHVFDAPESYSFTTRQWRKLLSYGAATDGRLVLAVSEYSKSRLVALGIAKSDQIHVVSNGVGHLAALSSHSYNPNNAPLKTPYFVALSSLQDHKNITVLLQAFARPDMQNAQLVLVGKSTKQAFLSAGHVVPDNVHFPGFVSNRELAALYQGAVAVLTPSRTEGFGLPPAEALTLGTPAIAAPCGALPEVCGDGALYADPDNPEDWAISAQLLMSQPALRSSLIAAGRAHISDFTWENAARAVIAALDQHRVAS